LTTQGGRAIDANLLVPLHVLLEERNLTRAGTRLAVSQPAMTGALTRLRRHFGDELLVRNGRGYDLTPLAEELRPVVAAAVSAVEGLVGNGPRFSPDTTHRTFAMSLTGYAMTVVTRPLVRVLSERAPHIDVDFSEIPINEETLKQHLLRRDLIIGPLGFGIPGRRQPLFTDEFVCLVSRDNPRLADGRLTLADLREMEHVVAHFGPGGSSELPDQVALRAAGIERSVRVVVPGLLTLPIAVADTELCTFVPRRLARQCAESLGLTVAATPLPRIEMVEAAHWHPSRVDDTALSWLRGILHDVAVTLEDDTLDRPDT
jgi:DNA-binding transcriptional LysR family regulator